MSRTSTDIAQRLRAHAPEVVAGLVVLVAARQGGVGAALPVWGLPALVLLVAAISAWVYTWADGAARGTALHVRTASQALALAVAAYASGAGPALVVPLLLLGLTDTVRHAGAGARPTALGWGLASLAAGQAAIATGLAPSLLSIPASHAVGGVGAVLLILVSTRVARLAKASEEARHAVELESGRTRALLENASDMTLVISDACITYQSPSAEQMLGYGPDEVLGRRYLELVHPQDRPGLVDFVHDLVARPRETGLVTCRLRAKDGHWVPVESSCRNLMDDPLVAGVVVNSRDVTERRELEEALEHRAFHDELTGLANRSLLIDRLRHAWARAERGRGHFAVLYVDLDGFKPINDSYGHVTGDAVLIAAAQRLSRTVRLEDTVARLGGDEFAVMVECAEGSNEAVRVAERVLEAVKNPVEVGSLSVRITACIGIAMCNDADDAVDVLRNADIAMYRAKRSGTSRYAVFEREMHTAVADRLKLENELQRAIEEDQIVVHYQPIVRLTDSHVIGMEALARWEHPEHGMVPPGGFIPVAEQTGQIVEIGMQVLEKSCHQLAEWRRAMPGADHLMVSVNVSMRQLLDVDLPREVDEVLRRTELPADRLTLELTESALAHDAERTLEVLHGLKAVGVNLALDDFGTGYSSLSYLHRFPVDVLKIDRSFVSSAGAGAESRGELARAMVELGRSLELVTIAEGIEEAEELQHFQGLGCPWGQGFLFARPADAGVVGEALIDLLAPAVAGQRDDGMPEVPAASGAGR